MNEKPVEKIIGWVYFMIDKENMAAVDIYEGNYIKLMTGGVLTRTAARKQDYDRAVALYEECVEKDEMIPTAYEQNRRLHLDIKVPEITADPQAAEREWEIRKQPELIHYGEPPKERRRRLFGKKAEQTGSIPCPRCKAPNPGTQKFCGECGQILLSLPDAATEEAQEDAPVPTPTTDTTSPQAVHDPGRPVGKAAKEEPPGKGAGHGKKGRLFFLLPVFLFIAIIVAEGFFLLPKDRSTVIYDLGNQEAPSQTVPEGHVVIKTTRELPPNTRITAEDLEGIILSGEQYEKYSHISTYIDGAGEAKEQRLLLWAEKDLVAGQYTTDTIPRGSLLYDTSVTSRHVVADKTYVEVDIDGKSGSYEADPGELPGSTKIQVVAVIKTDGKEPLQILLTEMILKDRSLESIFDSAGQDILDMLSGQEDESSASPDTENKDTEQEESQ